MLRPRLTATPFALAPVTLAPVGAAGAQDMTPAITDVLEAALAAGGYVGLCTGGRLAGGAGPVSAAGQAAKAGTNTSGAGGFQPGEPCGRTAL